MRLIWRILLFTMFFNIAAVFVASTGWFGDNVLWGDVSKITSNKMNDGEKILAVFAGGGLSIFSTVLIIVGVPLSFISTRLAAISIMFGLFITMFNNSKGLIESLRGVGGGIGSSTPVLYLMGMFFLAVIMLVIIETVNIAGGQQGE